MSTAHPHSRLALSSLVAIGLSLGLVSFHPIKQAFAQAVTPQLRDAGASEVSLTAIPPRLGEVGEIKVKPGQKFQATARVLNTGTEAVEIESFVSDFVIGEDGKTPVQVKEAVDNRWSLASWIVLSPSRQTIGSKKTGTINVLIDVPKDARPGGHYAMLLHQPASPLGTEKGTSAIGVNQQVGTLIYVVVEGQINEEAFIRDFAFKPNFSEYGPANFAYGVENQSDVHIRPAGLVEFFNLFHQKVGEVTVEPQNVFPGSQRAFSGSWPVRWGFGPYKAVLTVSYGSQGQVATATATIWLLPFSIIIASVILLLAVITGILAIRNNLTRRPPKARDDSSASNSSSTPSA